MYVFRGDVFYVELFGIGSEQDGVRPVIVVQNDIGNRYSPTTIGVPLTSSLIKNKLPTHVDIVSCKNLVPSIALCEQIFTIDKSRLENKVGKISEYEMNNIDEALIISIGLNNKTKNRIEKKAV